MDFEKIKTAAEDIKLTDAEKENIILLCQESKKTKKKSRFVPVAAAAAVAVFAFVIFSPGFLLKASEADKNFAPQENAVANDYELLADSIDNASGAIIQSSTAEMFRSIYFEIPKEFRELISEEEYAENDYKADLSGGMRIVWFIKEFNIPKESFEKANAAYAKRVYSDFGLYPLLKAADYKGQEEAEIFNSDIIYLFDEEKINEYYARPDYEFNSMREYAEAVENGYVSLSQKVPEEYFSGK